MLSIKTHMRSAAQMRGFTVVELLVTLSIVVLVTGIVLIRYSSFNSSVLLSSQAYLTAFDIREAQSLAVSVRGRGTQFYEEYGLYFDMSSRNSYLLFQDNGTAEPIVYNAGEELGTPYLIDPRFEIINVCGTNGASRTCYANDPKTTDEVIDPAFNHFTISFQRPDFDASFHSSVKSALQSVEIHVGNEGSPIVKKISVYTSGQIVVE